MLDAITKFLGEKNDFGVSDRGISSVANAQHYSLAELLPYISYEDSSQLFFNKVSVGFVFETIPLTGFDERVEKELINLLEHTLPVGSNLQVMLYASHSTDEILDNWISNRKEGPQFLIEASIKRKEFLRQKNIRNFRLIFSYSQTGSDLGAVEKQKLISLKSNLKNVFSSVSLPVKEFDASNLICLLDEMLNMKALQSVTDQAHNKQVCNKQAWNKLAWNRQVWNSHDSISNQIISPSTHTKVDESGIYQGKSIARSYMARRFPRMWNLGAMIELLGEDGLRLDCPFLIHLGIHIVDDSSTKAKMFAKAVRAEDQANSPFTKWMSSLGEELEEWREVRKSFDQGSRVVKTGFNVVLFSNTRLIEIEEQKFLSLYRSKGWELVTNNFVHLPALLSILPMSWGEGAVRDMSIFKKIKTTLAKEPANLMPLQGEWQGTKTPGMLFVGRKGQIFNWHSFDNDAGNYNVCVVGRSGSGKSVFMQELVSSTIGMGGRVFVIDVGRSFEKMASLYEGRFVEFTLSKPICINPFSCLTEELGDEEIENFLSMLKNVIAMMAAPQGGTSDIENSIIEKAIKFAYKQHGQKTLIDHVIKELEAENDSRASDLARQLYSYSSMGIYSKFFTGVADLNFKENLVVIEFEELRQKKDLRNVVLQTLILQITNQMILGERSKKPFNIVIDEAWDMLRGGNSGEFIETLARTLRKFNGSLVVGTQSVNDFYSSPAAQAAFDNSDWLCLLSQKKESIAKLKESGRLVIDDHMENVLKSVNTKHGEYAEVMIYGPPGYAVGRLILDPFSQMLYSTKAEDYQGVMNLKKKGLTTGEAIGVMITPKEKAGSYE